MARGVRVDDVMSADAHQTTDIATIGRHVTGSKAGRDAGARAVTNQPPHRPTA